MGFLLENEGARGGRVVGDGVGTGKATPQVNAHAFVKATL